MRWVGHVASLEEMRMHTNLWSENPKGRDYSKDLGVDGSVIVEWILEK
jgi:hypothetical protein